MLAPVIFISLCSPPLAGAEHSWWMQTKTSIGANQYFFYKFFTWNIFSIKLFQA
ncbi:hypothetical protein RZO07_13490 [Pseudomonas protegens]|uniref:hypothetical protein n=1 Tax=Pseudomonas protegens TaxID=380021 RepID=UPI00293703B4|nr:hypothetical protein [Pseudomonas protegens]WOE82180.1 hypothetical protein RZO07_13490 [Pseudomonas protegens]